MLHTRVAPGPRARFPGTWLPGDVRPTWLLPKTSCHLEPPSDLRVRLRE